MRLSQVTDKLLSQGYLDSRKLFSFRLSPASLEKMGAASEAFVLSQLERGFRTLDFYKQLEEVGP